MDPKSMTALKQPLVTSKFPALTFPWIQTGGRTQLVFKACFQAEVAASPSTVPPKSLIA
jgi:hypothetical protein